MFALLCITQVSNLSKPSYLKYSAQKFKFLLKTFASFEPCCPASKNARRVLAHVRAFLDAGQYGECRETEQACLARFRHGSGCRGGMALAAGGMAKHADSAWL